MNKYIFLDIDGVLNTVSSISSSENIWLSSPKNPELDLVFGHMIYQIEEEKVDLLNQIVKETSAKIIISSTWRLLFKLDDLISLLKFKGLIGEIVGVTPNGLLNREWGKRILRSEEIYAYLLENNLQNNQFVIIDDDDDAGISFEDKFVKTIDGLTLDNVDQVINILK